MAQGGTKAIPQIRFTVGVSSCDLFLHGDARPIWNVGGSIVVGQKRMANEDGDLWLALAVEHFGSTFFVWSRKKEIIIAEAVAAIWPLPGKLDS